jgi:hypothetical protein
LLSCARQLESVCRRRWARTAATGTDGGDSVDGVRVREIGREGGGRVREMRGGAARWRRSRRWARSGRATDDREGAGRRSGGVTSIGGREWSRDRSAGGGTESRDRSGVGGRSRGTDGGGGSGGSDRAAGVATAVRWRKRRDGIEDGEAALRGEERGRGRQHRGEKRKGWGDRLRGGAGGGHTKAYRSSDREGEKGSQGWPAEKVG